MNRRSAHGLLFAVGTSGAAAGIGSIGSRQYLAWSLYATTLTATINPHTVAV